jgi:hypothetical protein
MRLFPGGQPAIYPAKMIDWQATEKFNLLPPPPKPAAAAVTEPLVTPTVARASAGEVTRTGGILELKMIGGGHATATAAGEPGDAQAGAAASGAKPADPNATASIVASLTRELADLRGVQASMAESKSKVESDLAAAQARAAKDAPQGVSNYQSPAQQAIEQSNAALKDLNEHLATVEKRIGAIRDRLIELGAPIN